MMDERLHQEQEQAHVKIFSPSVSSSGLTGQRNGVSQFPSYPVSYLITCYSRLRFSRGTFWGGETESPIEEQWPEFTGAYLSILTQR